MYECNTQAIYNMCLMKQKVDAKDLLNECIDFYNSIKAYGVNQAMITYEDYNGKKIVTVATDFSEIIRAIIGFVVKLKYRWTDTSGRLEKHLGLSSSIYDILSTHTKIFNHTGSNEILSVQDVIERFLES